MFNKENKKKVWLGVGVFAAVGSVLGYLYWKSQKIDVVSGLPEEKTKIRKNTKAPTIGERKGIYSNRNSKINVNTIPLRT